MPTNKKITVVVQNVQSTSNQEKINKQTEIIQNKWHKVHHTRVFFTIFLLLIFNLSNFRKLTCGVSLGM